MLRGRALDQDFSAVARAVGCLLLALILVICTASAASAQTQPSRRIALVMGNATYTNGGVLDNPEADADVVAAKLRTLGFEVTSDKNLGQGGMRELISNFMARVRDNDMVVIYYAGHGIEADGRDYMLPVDVKLETPTAVQFQGIPLDMLYSDKQTFGVMIIFDACRDNPFLRKVKGAVAGTHALSPPVGALVLFSASSGDVAEDGGVDPAGGTRKNSVFATAFTNALSTPDASIQRIYQTTLREVRTQTSNRQAPQRFGDLAEDFTFNMPGGPPRTYGVAALPPAAAPAPAASEAAPVADSTRLAANAPATGGATYRSIPQPAQETAAAPTPAPAMPAPTPAAAATLAALTPPQRATAEPAAQPVPAPPAPAPQQVASLTKPPPAAAPSSSAFSSAPASTGAVSEMHFTIAGLGENVMPPAPQLATVPTLNLPARFCSVQEQIDYLNNTFRPAYETAYRNNAIAIAYLSALNVLGQEYNAKQSGFVFRIKEQFDAFAPVANKANETSNAVLGLDAQIRRIPVEACAKG